MLVGKLPVPGRPTIWMIVGQGPIALAVGDGGVVWTFYSPLSFLSSFSLSLWDRLKYCIKGPLTPKQPTNRQSSTHYIKQPKRTKPEVPPWEGQQRVCVWMGGCFNRFVVHQTSPLLP